MAEVRALTSLPGHHFFGYYGINPWDATGTRHLALRTDFDEHIPTPEDVADVGLIDIDGGNFESLAQTSAFNLQQGSMLHWIDSGRAFTFNAWRDGQVASRVHDIATRTQRWLDRPVAAVSPKESIALGLDYGRMFHCREVVGYANDQRDIDPRPTDDGIWRIDLVTGKAELAMSIRSIIAHGPPPPPGVDNDGNTVPDDQVPVWMNHVLFNRAGDRVMFFLRVKTGTQPGRRFATSLWTINPDGSEPRCCIPWGWRISHFYWMNDRTLLVSTDWPGERMRFITLPDADGEHEPTPLGLDVLPDDGHASLSPDGRWLVCDTYPRGPKHECELLLYDIASSRRIDLGRFPHPPHITGAIRCDLHPRWHPDGTKVTFDSRHEGSRQVYVVERLIG